MTLRERFERMENEDIVIIGQTVENVLKSEFGQLLKLMIENLNNVEIQNSRANHGSSDKVLGRLEGYRAVMDDLEGFVLQKQRIQTPRQEEDLEVTSADEHYSPLRGGAI